MYSLSLSIGITGTPRIQMLWREWSKLLQGLFQMYRFDFNCICFYLFLTSDSGFWSWYNMDIFGVVFRFFFFLKIKVMVRRNFKCLCRFKNQVRRAWLLLLECLVAKPKVFFILFSWTNCHFYLFVEVNICFDSVFYPRVSHCTE